MDAALIELGALVVDQLLMARARRDEVRVDWVETLRRRNRIPRELVEQTYDSSAILLHFGECMRLAATIDHVERLAGKHVDVRRREMPRSDGSVSAKVGEELVKGETALTRA